MWGTSGDPSESQNLSLKIEKKGGGTNKFLSKLLLLTRQVLLGPGAWNLFKLRKKTQYES